MVVAEAMLTHLPLVSVNWVSIGSSNGLWPVRRQAITLTNADLLWIGTFGINFSEIRIEIQNFSFTKMHLKRSSVQWRPFCPGGDDLIQFNSSCCGILWISAWSLQCIQMYRVWWTYHFHVCVLIFHSNIHGQFNWISPIDSYLW